MCRLCGEREETISHITTVRKKLAQKQYKNWRHDQVARVVYRKLCQNYDLQCNETWYDHSPDAVMENDPVKLLWNFGIQTDQHLDQNRSDIVVIILLITKLTIKILSVQYRKIPKISPSIYISPPNR